MHKRMHHVTQHAVTSYKEFCMGGSKPKSDILQEPETRGECYVYRAVIELEMHVHCQVAIEREIIMQNFVPLVFAVYINRQGSKQ